ncbi:MAG: hypothetical protein ACK56W_22235 [Pirellula sp.]|jgi:hypothetical protein|nr:hypothetical protein [Pirellula sp.]
MDHANDQTPPLDLTHPVSDKESLKLSPQPLIGLAVVFALLHCLTPFFLGIYPSSDGELFYANALIQTAVLSYLICVLQGRDYKTHLWFPAALLILTFGMAMSVAYDELPRRLPAEDAPYFLMYTLPWYWFCTFVAMSSIYLVQRVVLASVLSSYRFVRGTLKFSVVNMFISTIMVFICLTLVSNVAQLEYRYAMTIYIISLLSMILTPTTWIALMIHRLASNRPIVIACVWSIFVSGVFYSVIQLINKYGKNLVDIPVFRTLIDGKLTDRDLDSISLIMIPIPMVVAITVTFRPIRQSHPRSSTNFCSG